MSQLDARRVTVVIPVFRAAHLERCLKSVFSQTTLPDEVIVVSDGSPDRDLLARTVEPYGSRVTVLRQRRGGAGAARNTGIKAAHGELIAFLDADDYWFPSFLATQLDLLAANPGASLAFGNALFIGNSPLAGRRYMDVTSCIGQPTLSALLSQRCTVLTSSVLVERQALMDSGLFDASLSHGQELDLWIRLARNGVTFVYSTAATVARRVAAEGVPGDVVRELSRTIEILERAVAQYDLPADDRRMAVNRIAELDAQLQVERGARSLRDGDLFDALRRFEAAATDSVMWRFRAIRMALRVAPGFANHTMCLRAVAQLGRSLRPLQGNAGALISG